MPTDGLPCNVHEIPPYLYVNSDVSKRRTSNIIRKVMREQVFRDEYDSFLNSREGKNYFLGLLPKESSRDKKNVTKKPDPNDKKNVIRQTKSSLNYSIDKKDLSNSPV